MAIKELRNPDFIIGEVFPKSGDEIQDNREFIYCPSYMTLIEVVPLNHFHAAFPKDQPQKEFTYQEEEFLLVVTQDNISAVNAQLEIQILEGKHEPITANLLIEKAWENYLSYLNEMDEL